MRFRILAGAAFYQQGRISYITWKSWYNYKNICERNYSLKDGDYPAAQFKPRGGGGLLSYMGHIGMGRGEG